MGLSFETTLKEIPVTIDGKTYVLQELDGKGQSKWREAVGGELEIDSSGKPKITNINMKEPELTLLPLCMLNEKGKFVTREEIEKWPSSVLRGLFETAQELSGLTEAARRKQQVEAKNS